MRWVFYTSGTTADPKGARHTDLTVKASAIGMIEALEITDRRPCRDGVPVHAHRRHRLAVHDAADGLHVQSSSRRSCPNTTIPVLQREHVTLAGAGTPFHMAYLAAQRDQPDTPLFPETRAFPGGGAAEAARSCTTR